mmetsp:Transcript_715/g.2524  ORF Transcript_715/g.2524 Transcript_715/m.2524 type:complete len:298 (-) Transcript_715:37-930(-)
MKSRRSVASSALNSGSLRQWFHAASSSLCATISVSGMKRPPKTDSPKFHLSACFFCAASCSSLFCAFANAAFCPTAASGPPLSSRTRDPAAAMPPAPISCTIFEPTTQPSAKAPNSSTCARFVIPKPTTMGRSVRLAPSFSAASRIDSTTALHSATTAGSRGKKTLPAPNAPAAGSATPRSAPTASVRNACGMPVSMPAPSPEEGSQPQPPRCAIRTSIVFASRTISWLACPLRCATIPTPQESRSSAGSYRPCLGGSRRGGRHCAAPLEAARARATAVRRGRLSSSIARAGDAVST